MSLKDNFVQVRYYSEKDPYHYTIDNRPLLDLEANIEFVADSLDNFAMTPAVLQNIDSSVQNKLSQQIASIQTSVASANTSASQALASSSLAISAWASSTAPSENIAVISQSFHKGTIVKAFFYDASKDSDGGAWRKRCQGKSWFNESLNLIWLGQAASASAAWALTGATTGAYFQNTTDGKFYALGASSPSVTEVFRGNRAEFPEQTAIIVESSRVIIYDLTQSNCPMWMVLSGGGNNAIGTGTSLTSAVASNALIYLGSAGGLCVIDFIKDTAYKYTSTSSTNNILIGPLSGRNASPGRVTFGSVVIVSNTVNDVVATILPDAPIDIATGLPIPTIATATAAGLSVIKHDGSVVNLTVTNNSLRTVMFHYPYVSIDIAGNTAHYQSIYDLRTLTSHTISNIDSSDAQRAGYFSSLSGAIPSYKNSPSGSVNPNLMRVRDGFANGDNQMVALLKENPSAWSKSMIAYITNTYNSGWMVGDIRGAWLADTVPEVLTASGELVTNGTFDIDASGWTPTNATLSVVSGAMRITATASAAPYSNFTITTVVGRMYKVVVQLVTPMAGKNVFINAGTAANSSNLGFVSMGTAAGTYNFDFVATSTTTHINFSGVNTFVAGDYFDVDNISVKLADSDRSVKNNGVIVNGSITKAAVATGAQLVAYSGFSAANYFEQPYNANMDFGTGDFHVSVWVTQPSGGATGAIFDRYDAGQAGSRFYLGMSGTNWVMICAATNSPVITPNNAPTGIPIKLDYLRVSGVLKLYVNSVLTYSAANTANITNTAATFVVGHSQVTTSAAWSGSIALLRVSATAPSPDQISYIYNTEKCLFQAGAQGTIDGTSTAVTALAYDDMEDALHVGTSWGRSKFRDLMRIESASTQVGSITSISAGQGCHITGGAYARFYQPAMYLREELRRKEEARKALGKEPVFFDFDATTGQTAFSLPKGYTTKAVYSAGILKRNGSGKDYTISFDGFVETVNFTVAPGNGVWVSLMAVRA